MSFIGDGAKAAVHFKGVKAKMVLECSDFMTQCNKKDGADQLEFYYQ